MPRSSSTGAYTRVDNSFSNPVVGTTISPTDADTFSDDVEASMNSFLGVSTTSLAIGTGAKTFVVSSPSTKVFFPNTNVRAFSLANSANYMDCTVTSFNTSTGDLVTDCFAVGGSGTLADWVIVSAGARGATGAVGTTGASSGIKQTYSTTTTDADPGAGVFRLNNATPASATAAYLDNVDAGGSTVSGIFDLFDDSGSTVKGFIRFEKSSDATVWAQFQVTGSVVDGTGYRKLTLANGAGSGAFTNADAFSISFYRTGDPGAIGGSTGSTDNRVIRADGTGGATVQNSAVSIDDNGVVSGAVFGNTGLKIQDTNASHNLTIAPGSNITADRTLTVTTGDADRTLTLSGNATLIAGTATVTAGAQTLTGGFTATPFAAGTKSSGTYTPLYSDGNFQTATNGGAHTLAPPANDCTIIVQYTNNGSAGAVTTSGFTKKTGDTITTVNGDDFFMFITKVGSFSHLHVQALQ